MFLPSPHVTPGSRNPVHFPIFPSILIDIQYKWILWLYGTFGNAKRG